MPKTHYLLIAMGVCLLVVLGGLGLRLVESGQPPALVVLPATAANVAATADYPTAAPPPSPRDKLPLAAPTVTRLVGSNAANDNPQPPFAPTASEHWAEADLTKTEVRLYQGDIAQAVYQMSYGRGDTANTTTFPGLFTVYVKDASLHKSVVAGEYIRYWVGFDPKWANGFHSVIMDRSGTVIDDRLGQAISSGCIRTALPNAAAIFAWLPLGAHVWVHY